MQAKLEKQNVIKVENAKLKKFNDDQVNLRPMSRREIELCLIEMTDEKEEWYDKYRKLSWKVEGLEAAETRLKVFLKR